MIIKRRKIIQIQVYRSRSNDEYKSHAILLADEDGQINIKDQILFHAIKLYFYYHQQIYIKKRMNETVLKAVNVNGNCIKMKIFVET